MSDATPKKPVAKTVTPDVTSVLPVVVPSDRFDDGFQDGYAAAILEVEAQLAHGVDDLQRFLLAHRRARS